LRCPGPTHRAAPSHNGRLIRGMTMAVTALHAQATLRPGLTPRARRGPPMAYAGPWAYRGLVLADGWSLDEYEACSTRPSTHS